MLDYIAPILAAVISTHGGPVLTPEQVAVKKIVAYADSARNPIPTLQDYTHAGVNGVTSRNLSEFNKLVDSLESKDVNSAQERSTLVSQLPMAMEPFDDIVKTEYFTPFTFQSKVTYTESNDVHYFLENTNSLLINASVNEEGLITIAPAGNGSGIGTSEITLIAFTATNVASHSFNVTIETASFIEFSLLDFIAVSNENWNETAVRKVLHAFAYGGHATDTQIKTWAAMPPKKAIVQMLTFEPKNELLSPSRNYQPDTTSLERLAKFWNKAAYVKPENKKRFTTTPTSWETPTASWMMAVLNRGLNPFLHRVGLWETNYHMSVSQVSGVYPLAMLSHYDNIMNSLSDNRSYEQVIAQGAKNAAVAYQYGHNRNIFKDGKFRGNEDFAREYHQLFFGILGEYDHDYHESTTIPNTARALTDMKASWHPEEEGGPDREIVFGVDKHYSSDLEILNTTISGYKADIKIDEIAMNAITHEESLQNLPIMIISHLADDNPSAATIKRIQNSWAMMPVKRLLPFLRAYAVSTDFHSASRIKYASSIQRMMTTMNLLTIDNEENGYMFYYPNWELSKENIRVFSPTHAVFGHQTGLEASDNGNIFRINYNRSAKNGWVYWRYYECVKNSSGECPKDKDGNVIGVWEKKWKDVIPANGAGKYIVEDVARWLWERFIADGGKNYGELERAHLIALLNGKDLALFLDKENPLAIYDKTKVTTNSGILRLLNDGAVEQMNLSSSDISKRRNADYRINLAISFIAATPYIYAQEGQ